MHEGQALASLTCSQVLEVAKRSSGLTQAEIAAAMGVNISSVGCWFGEAIDKFVPLPKVAQLCQVLGNPIIILWLMARYEALRDETERHWTGDAEIVSDRMVVGLGQLSQALTLIRQTRSDGPMSPSGGRLVSEALLLSITTLAAAAREARGNMTDLPRRGRFLRPRIAPSWWRRLFGSGGEGEGEGEAAPESSRARRDALRSAETATLRCVKHMGALAGLLKILRNEGHVPEPYQATADRMLAQAVEISGG